MNVETTVKGAEITTDLLIVRVVKNWNATSPVDRKQRQIKAIFHTVGVQVTGITLFAVFEVLEADTHSF